MNHGHPFKLRANKMIDWRNFFWKRLSVFTYYRKSFPVCCAMLFVIVKFCNHNRMKLMFPENSEAFTPPVSHHLFNRLLDTVPQMVFILDMSGRFLWVNESTITIT